jgi:exodeoxyribonuclease V alpha subunit
MINSEKNIEVITGTIEIITYRNKDNGFFVCKVKVKGHKGNVPVTGATPVNFSVGEVISASGVWYQDPKYGMQFKANEVQVMLPKSISGIQRYLGSGVIKGIGPKTAQNIVEMFSDRSIDIIEKSPHELTKIRGINQEKAERISKSWEDSLKIKEMMLFLQSHGVTVNLAAKIYNNYGDAAINILRDNPYAMARDIKGIGFLSADKIAMNLGMKQDDDKRISAGVEYTLLQATTSGSCGLPMTILLEKAQEILKVPKNLIERVIHHMIVSERVIAMLQDDPQCMKITAYQDSTEKIMFSLQNEIFDADRLYFLDPLLFSKQFFFIERNVSEKLLAIAKTGQSIFSEVNLDDAIDQLQDKHHINLGDVQRDAIKQLNTSKVLVITGGPGTGKTTLINSILKIAKMSQQTIGQIKIKLAAPTGRAAKRISESSGAFSSTIHRMLEFDPSQGGFKYNDTNYLKCDLIVIDESSMIDIQIMNSILKALPRSVTLIIVGDVDQLPSIGAGQVLSDIINSDMVPTVKLNQVFRQAKHSKIITNAHMVNNGQIPYLGEGDKKSDFEFISVDDDIAAIEKVKEVMQRQSKDMVADVQLLTPMQRGSLGVKAVNPILQSLLNSDGLEQDYVEHFGIKYCINDKVIQTENNYNKGVFNGDIGFITTIDKENQEIIINFDGFDVIYDMSELDQISLAYAITIHKSQGSEYHTVIMPILTQHFIMLNKNLLYTGITRAKKQLIMIGQKRAVAMAIKSNRSEKRYSMLKSWLIKTFCTN